MKTFSSEFVHNYETYSFGYCNYALREQSDRIADIYGAGYLPYSGKPNVKDTFYMARSARVALGTFTPSSENRRIAKRFDHTLTRHATAVASFDTNDARFIDFCLSYFVKRHGAQVMPKTRLVSILEMNLITHIVSYTKDNDLVAYVFEVTDDAMTHFWYSFYDLHYIKQSLGLWLMLDSLRVAKANGKKHFYTGTVYNDKALYKANFPALEYWDGERWQADTSTLKDRARNDVSRTVPFVDAWKGA